MKVYELKPFGYCYGVMNALELIRTVKDKHLDKNVYVFGMLVHNNDVVKYLNGIDVITIDTSKIDKEERLNQFSSDDVVVFTAHGHDYKLEEILKKNNVIYYDATCKNVLKNLELIKAHTKNKQVIYIGKKNHPETEAALAISNKVVLYDIKDDIDYSLIKDNDPLICNQTTLSFLEIKDIHLDILSHFPKARLEDEICSSTRVRQENIYNFKGEVDLVLIIGSIQSSNTDKLYQIAKNKFLDSKVIKVENLNELKNYDLYKYHSALITSGTSTPLQSILEIKEYLGGINNE